jgi:hypothetical protein
VPKAFEEFIELFPLVSQDPTAAAIVVPIKEVCRWGKLDAKNSASKVYKDLLDLHFSFLLSFMRPECRCKQDV